MGQKFAAYDSTGAITAYYDSADSPVPAGVNAIAITDAQWQTALSQPGWTVADGALAYVTPPGPALSDVQASVKAAIRAYRDNLLLLTPFNGKVFQSDLASKIQIMVIAGQSALIPSAALWRTADNTYANMTLPLFQALMGTIMAREGAAYATSARMQDAVDALSSVDDVNAFNYSTGWPV
jgi:Domain of unknown function (DUF4376)